jgi:hypothetical protein
LNVAAIRSAHDAYRRTAEIAPLHRAAAEPAPAPSWHRVTQWANTDMDLRADHLVAIAGAVFFLIAGAVCGAWLQMG